MKQIPLYRKGNALFLFGKINGSINIEFLLDTGCSGTLLSKEVGDILFLRGNLKESDVKGTSTSSYGGIYAVQHKEINIRSLTFGKVKLKDLNATIGDRYGGTTLLGMAALDKMNGFVITKNMLIVDDGDTEAATITNNIKEHKPYRSRFKTSINRLRKIRELDSNGSEEYKFDYTKYIMLIYFPIQSCHPLLLEKKHKLVCDVLEELQPIIKDNLEDDEKHPHQRGAFITAYFNFFLASAYYGLERYEEALTYYDKAKHFFLSGSSVMNEIIDVSDKIRQKLKDRDKDKPKVFALAKATTFEEDVQAYNLHQIEFEDNYYGTGEKKSAWGGFQTFEAAFTFCRMNHKRLEVLKKEGDTWQRTGCIPSDNLSYMNLEIEEGYKAYSFASEIDSTLEKLTEELGENQERIAQIVKNAEKAKGILKSEDGDYRYRSTVILQESDLSFDANIKNGAGVSWHGQELILAALDAEEFITKRLADDVLAGRIIPCAYGQMPEDFIYLADKTSELRPYGEDGYTANNDPENSRCIGPFILYDDFNCVGYGRRATYDDKYWRWEGVEHSNYGGFPDYGDDPSKENDKPICYWQLVIKRNEDENGIIHPEAF